MSLSSLSKVIDTHYGKGLPFVAYCRPDEESVEVLLQHTLSALPEEPFSEDGFIFHPFDPELPGFQLSRNKSELMRADLGEFEQPTKFIDFRVSEQSSEQNRYLGLIEDARIRMAQKGIKKIVTSRKVEVPLRRLDLDAIIARLFRLYPTAFRYIWYHPETGLWCGATPELLVETDGTSFRTMALAGTRENLEYADETWTDKEREEQQLVVDFIVNRLQKVTSVVKLSRTYSHQAGAVVHLRTDITGILKRKKTNLERILNTLHPTSAVCGMPRTKAMDFLKAKEGYDRSFYSGYLGYHQAGLGQASIYVNLRCMRLSANLAEIYVGGGITDASDPLSEWQETVNKQQTMLQVLGPLLSNS